MHHLKSTEVKRGLRVRIHPESLFSGQSIFEGQIIKVGSIQSIFEGQIIKVGSIEPWHKVKFEDGYTNSYRTCDLMLAQPENNEQALSLLKKE